jgi:hypothetical protein
VAVRHLLRERCETGFETTLTTVLCELGRERLRLRAGDVVQRQAGLPVEATRGGLGVRPGHLEVDG